MVGMEEVTILAQLPFYLEITKLCLTLPFLTAYFP